MPRPHPYELHQMQPAANGVNRPTYGRLAPRAQWVPQAPRFTKWSVARHDIEKCPFPMCVTPEALNTLLETIGSRPPETGGKGWSPAGVMGFDVIEFDPRGSAAANGSVYAPDTDWGKARVDAHLAADLGRAWSGDLHSHPGNYGRPSPAVGQGLGDLGYVREVFAMNEWMEWFMIPILTGTGTGDVLIHPWVCQRGPDNVPRLHIAEFIVCGVGNFPERRCNAAWEAAHAQTNAPSEGLDDNVPVVLELPRPLDPNRFEALWKQHNGGASVTVDNAHIELTCGAFCLQLELSPEYPLTAPTLLAATDGRATYPPIEFAWRDVGACGTDPEMRLIGLLQHWAARCEMTPSF